VRTEIQIAGATYPLGDLIFSCGGVLVGFEICEDAWVAERPGAELAQRGVDVIFNPSASHFAFGKHEVRKRFVMEGSRAFHVSYVYANLLGNEAGRAIYDGDAMIASCGHLLASGPRFSFADHYLTTAVVDVDHTRMLRARTSSFQPTIAPGESEQIALPFEYSSTSPDSNELSAAAWETSDDLKEEEFARAVSLALFDYLRKSRSSGFVVSLSGGADSAAVACLCAMLVRLGCADIGQEGLLNKLSYIRELSEVDDQTEIVRRLLTCVYQSTRNSSEVTRNAARDVASSLGAEYLEFDVDGIVQQYIQMVSGGIGRPLRWETDDIALQNIQARARAPGVWMLANLHNALLLSTSNRSEAAVGYATMDGDTSGGLSPIAGIDKAFLRHWLCWLEQHGPDGMGAVRALRAVNQQQPTAELRPSEAAQTDERDLMPYELLDTIERAAIRDKLIPVEVFERLRAHYGDTYSPAELECWVDRFFRLWSRNQWKRERYAPSFHLDDENLDPKTWCRFPILSGGFQRELEELAEHVKNITDDS
jgi:NAD+ synthase (glutamine-hydrolysing)